jgi:hypothetical protein
MEPLVVSKSFITSHQDPFFTSIQTTIFAKRVANNILNFFNDQYMQIRDSALTAKTTKLQSYPAIASEAFDNNTTREFLSMIKIPEHFLV